MALKFDTLSTDEQMLDVYDAVVRSPSLEVAAQHLGLSKDSLLIRLRKSKRLKAAQRRAETRREGKVTLGDYVLGRLSPVARSIWEKLQYWEELPDAEAKAAAILQGQPERLRQELFIHALLRSSYNVSTAARLTHVNHQTLRRWRAQADFQQLVEEVQQHKKDFFEDALVRMVANDVPAAVIFANRTLNADRGYSEKVEMRHSGNVTVGIDLESLDLPLDVKRQILDAIKRQEEQGQVIDVTESPTLPALPAASGDR